MERLVASLTLLLRFRPCSSGPFRWVRHPLYSSALALWLGARGKIHVHGSELTVAGPAELQRMI